MIEVINLTKNYGRFTAVDDVTFTLKTNSICGLIGPNGAGKTTVLKSCAGIFKPDAGEVTIDNIEAYDSERARRELFYLPDEAYYPFGATLKSMARFYKGYYPDFNLERFDRMIKMMELNPKKRMHALSKGMQRQAAIALAVAASPKYLLMDESFDGIDPLKRNMIKDLLLEYMAVSGCGIMISSHNLDEISAICDHVIMLEGKQIKIDCETDELIEHYLKVQAVADACTAAAVSDRMKELELTVTASGAVITGILRGDVDAQLARLTRLGAKNIQAARLTLEEIFMLEAEKDGGDYDVENIFART